MSDQRPESIHDQAAAYALGALDPAECAAFEAELARSADLQREVAEYREVAALLPLQDRSSPSSEVKDRLLARVRAEKVASLSPIKPKISAPAWLWAGLAATLLASVGLGFQVRSLTTTLGARDSVLSLRETELANRERTLNSILEPGVALIPLTATGEAPPLIQLFWDRQRNLAVLHAFRLPPAGEGRAYQLWILAGGAPVPSRLFNSESDGHALVEGVSIPADSTIVGFAVTEEPAGGSTAPTTPILVVGLVGAG